MSSARIPSIVLSLAALALPALPWATAAKADPVPGAELWVSDTLLESCFDNEVASQTPIDSLILGSWVKGMAKTTAKSTLVFEPAANEAIIRMEIAAQVAADATAHTEAPFDVQVWTQMRSLSYVHATKRFYVQPSRYYALSSGETTSTALSRLDVRSLNVGAGGLFRRIKSMIAYREAWQEIWANRLRMERLTAQTVEQEFNTRLDQEVPRVVEDANGKIYEKLYRPLVDGDVLPGTPFVRTSLDHLQLGVYDPAPPEEREDAPAEPTFPRKYELHLRLRASYLEAAAKHSLAGQTKTEAELADQIGKLTGKVQPLPDEATMLALTFSDDQPVSITAQGGKITLEMRTKGIAKGPRAYPPMYMRVTYHLARTPAGGFQLQREGDVEVFPPRGESKPVESLTMQEKVVQQFLRKKLRETVFTDTLDLTKVTPPASLGKLGDLYTRFAVADSGWLLLGLDRLGQENL